MIVYSVKDIIDAIVKSNPFWERFICIEGIVRRNRKGEFFIELDGHNKIPIANGHDMLLIGDKRKYHGFLNYRDQQGYGGQKSTRTEKIHFDRGSLDFVFYIADENKVEEYSVKTRIKHRMDIFNYLQQIWNRGGQARIGVICSEKGCAFDDVMYSLKLNDILRTADFYELLPLYVNFELSDEVKKHSTKKELNRAKEKLEKDFVSKLKEAEDGDFDIVIISRGGGSDSEEGYGLLEDKNVKTFIANMAKLTICAVGHVNDRRSEESFHYFFDFDARTPSLAGVRLREWLLAYKTIPESIEVSGSLVSQV